MNAPHPSGPRMLPTDRIAYSAITERPALKLPGGARMAIWVIVNICPFGSKLSSTSRARLRTERPPDPPATASLLRDDRLSMAQGRSTGPAPVAMSPSPLASPARRGLLAQRKKRCRLLAQ